MQRGFNKEDLSHDIQADFDEAHGGDVDLCHAGLTLALHCCVALRVAQGTDQPGVM